MKRFEALEFNEYTQRFEVNIYEGDGEEPVATEYLPAVFHPDFDRETDDIVDWAQEGKMPIIGFEYQGEVIPLDMEDL